MPLDRLSLDRRHHREQLPHAHGADVLTQFLIEAIVLSSLGGLVGVALGISGSIMLGNYMNMQIGRAHV